MNFENSGPSTLPQNLPPVFQHMFLPFNSSYVELPEARAEDLTPRSGWIAKLNDVERKYLEERNTNAELNEKIQRLHLQFSTLETTSEMNLEQLSGHILSLEKEIEMLKGKEQEHQSQLKVRDDYIAVVKETIQENEDHYRKHLNSVKIEYEKLEENNRFLKERINELGQEVQSVRLQAAESKNEAARVQGMRDTENTLLQNQLKETQSEHAKLNSKCFELTRELERTRVLLEDSTKKNLQYEREIIGKENEYKRVNELLIMNETSKREKNGESERVLTAKISTITQQAKEERSDYETRFKLEQQAAQNLRSQIDQLNRRVQELTQENRELKAVNKINEEALLKAEFLEKEITSKFNSLKAKYDTHFSRTEQDGYDKEVKYVRCREELESLKVEKEQNEKLIFQYQNFLKMHNLDYEFNGLSRLGGRFPKKTPGELKHEARESAVRTYYIEQERDRYNTSLKEKYATYDDGTSQKVEGLKNRMDDISGEMENEWRQLFTNISEFKTKIAPY